MTVRCSICTDPLSWKEFFANWCRGLLLYPGRRTDGVRIEQRVRHLCMDCDSRATTMRVTGHIEPLITAPAAAPAPAAGAASGSLRRTTG